MRIRAWLTKARFSLAWLIMPADVKALTLRPDQGLEILPKAPTPLWTSRRKAMFSQGYDPRDTATP